MIKQGNTIFNNYTPDITNNPEYSLLFDHLTTQLWFWYITPLRTTRLNGTTEVESSSWNFISACVSTQDKIKHWVVNIVMHKTHVALIPQHYRWDNP